jgi:homoserine O-succinyltransferase/O-acetyltransferase
MNWLGPSSLGGRDPGRLTIGVVNNASDRGLRSIERQFLRVLEAASNSMELNIAFFTCPEIQRSIPPQSSTGHAYADIEELYDTNLDALIVTGMEPQATALEDEPIWGSLTKIADWAEEHAVPVVWSCLAAHAAVLYLDGISRSRLPAKLSGVFECHVADTDHELMAGLPSRWVTPHSRYHGLNENALTACGYQVLSRSSEASVDIFLKSGTTNFVFIQGHPEYDGDTLLREYKRDVRRYIIGERDDFPMAPKHCFTTGLEAGLNRVRQDALAGKRDPTIVEVVSQLVETEPQPNAWHLSAAQFYANWLTFVAKDNLRCFQMDRKSHRDTDRRGWTTPTVGDAAPNP